VPGSKLISFGIIMVMKPSALDMLGKCSVTELSASPVLSFLVPSEVRAVIVLIWQLKKLRQLSPLMWLKSYSL
jgi:hypothetical protein